MNSSITVIIPAYNRASLIAETLKSLLNQTLSAKEIIVVDDGSTDGTGEAAEREFSVFSEQFSGNSKSNIQNPTFKVLHQKNAGPGAARNRGLAEATGEFIHFFDSDDIAAPNKHEVQLRALLESGADIAYGPWIHGVFTGSRFNPVDLVVQQKGLPRGNLVKALLTNWSVAPHPCLFRRSILDKVRGFPENIWMGEDQLMFLRCILAGAKVVHTPDTLEMYRRENREKITASASGRQKFRVDWGRYLLYARDEVAKKHEDPAKWFGFRLRAWDAWEELRHFGAHEAYGVVNELEEIWNIWPNYIYRMERFLKQKKAGLKIRLFGSREGSAAKMGHLTNFQKELIKRSGYFMDS